MMTMILGLACAGLVLFIFTVQVISSKILADQLKAERKLRRKLMRLTVQQMDLPDSEFARQVYDEIARHEETIEKVKEGKK
jgi:uncharacterized protein YneF (UPF0154 family)